MPNPTIATLVALKDLSHCGKLIAIRVGGRADMGGAVDVDPKVFVTPLGFENGNFSPLEGTANRRAKQIRAEDQIIGAAKQHGAARQGVHIVVDHEVRDLLLDLAPAFSNA